MTSNSKNNFSFFIVLQWSNSLCDIFVFDEFVRIIVSWVIHCVISQIIDYISVLSFKLTKTAIWNTTKQTFKKNNNFMNKRNSFKSVKLLMTDFFFIFFQFSKHFIFHNQWNVKKFSFNFEWIFKNNQFVFLKYTFIFSLSKKFEIYT